MKKISIVVPIYNAKDYLGRCIESLQKQTHKNIEIILVNDGSKDNSLEIGKAYAAEDDRIILIDKENEGVAQTRNRGIAAATGDYIGFVDPDDWIEEKMYASLLGCMEKTDYEICMCNYYKDDKRTSTPKLFKITADRLTREEAIEQLVSNMIGMSDLKDATQYIMGSVWRSLYKRTFLVENQIHFEPGISIMEDLVFSVQAILKATGVAIDSGVYYHYVQNPKSILHSYNHYMWEDQMRVYQLLRELVEQAGLEEEMQSRLDIRYIGMAICAINNEMRASNVKNMRERLCKIKNIYRDHELRITLKRRVKGKNAKRLLFSE